MRRVKFEVTDCRITDKWSRETPPDVSRDPLTYLTGSVHLGRDTLSGQFLSDNSSFVMRKPDITVTLAHDLDFVLRSFSELLHFI